MAPQSIVEYFGKHEKYRCGYCKASDTSVSHGLWSHYLTAEDYQDMIDRGWRRSGKYCYKPMMNVTCCPQYTIRCEALNFKLSKSQKKVLKRMNKFLASGKSKNVDLESGRSSPCEDAGDCQMEYSYQPDDKPDMTEKDVNMILQNTGSEVKTAESTLDDKKRSSSSSEPSTTASSSNELQESIDSNMTSAASGPDPGRALCRKAKEIRKERRMQKLLKAGHSVEEALAALKPKQKCVEKSLEDFLNEVPPEPMHRLELRLVPSDLNNQEFSKTFEESYSVYQKYQMAIHNDPPEKCTKKQYTRFLVTNPLQLRLVPSCLDNEEFMSSLNDSYSVFKRYQMVVHQETENECNFTSYKEFLVISPIQSCGNSSSSTSLGSFHQQYWLDEKLIAVGVLDILPYCISSVYFYYDPDYSFLSLGTYASLREIAFTRELHQRHPELQYYYMGFYIHSCPKMRYKGAYSPSFLLCPETFRFHPIEKCIPKLDASRYHRLDEDPEAGDPDGVVHLNEVLILHQSQAMTFAKYSRICQNDVDAEEVAEYAHLVGRKCYHRILLYRS